MLRAAPEMTHRLRRIASRPTRCARPLAFAVVIALPIVWGCADDPPAAFIGPTGPPAVRLEWPLLARDGTVFNEIGAIYDDRKFTTYHLGLPLSRLVLYHDGTAGLQFLSPRFGFHEYPGTFERQEPLVRLDFVNDFLPWQAIASIRGDSLDVRYNDYMGHSDLVDGTYVRVATVP